MKLSLSFIKCAVIAAAIAFMGCSSAPEDSAKTTRFDAFFRDVLADRVPTQDLTPKMKEALTPSRVADIEHNYAPLGTFEKLQYLGEDSVQGYDRYHYAAVFDKGKQAVMFVLDSQGEIAGFFNE